MKTYYAETGAGVCTHAHRTPEAAWECGLKLEAAARAANIGYVLRFDPDLTVRVRGSNRIIQMEDHEDFI